MTITARPGRFRLHLSSAILLMFAAGGLIWANTADRSSTVLWGRDLKTRYCYSEHGWPFIALEHERYVGPGDVPVEDRPPVYRVEYSKAALDMGVMLGILLLFAAVSEHVIRLRAKVRHRPDTNSAKSNE